MEGICPIGLDLGHMPCPSGGRRLLIVLPTLAQGKREGFPTGIWDSITRRKKDGCYIAKIKAASSGAPGPGPTLPLRASSLSALPALQPALRPHAILCHVSSVPVPSCLSAFALVIPSPGKHLSPPLLPLQNPTTTTWDVSNSAAQVAPPSGSLPWPSKSERGAHPTSFHRPGSASLLIVIIPNCGDLLS